MSVYLPKNKSPFYAYDFQFRGERFHGSTGCTTRREAEQVEKAKRAEARQQARANPRQPIASLKIDVAAERYYQEVGQHHVNARDTEHNLARLIEYFGKDELLTEITDTDIAGLVAKRRAERRVPHPMPKGKKPQDYPFITPATVNRSHILVIKKLIGHAKRMWKVQFQNEPDWKLHILPEAEERVRELIGDESSRVEANTRDDYVPFFEYVRASGWRRETCVDLKWQEVNWEGGQIRKKGKGGKYVTLPITSHIRSILEPLVGHHPVFVFT